jgi:hypothetical protein
LRGHFSFDTPPTIPAALQAAGFPQATILISKAVSISGASAERNDVATIEAGTIPSYVDTPGASVIIAKIAICSPCKCSNSRLFRDRPRHHFCRIEGITPRPNAPIVQFSGTTL